MDLGELLLLDGDAFEKDLTGFRAGWQRGLPSAREAGSSEVRDSAYERGPRPRGSFSR